MGRKGGGGILCNPNEIPGALARKNFNHKNLILIPFFSYELVQFSTLID